MRDLRKSQASQQCSMHSIANRVHLMAITEDQTRAQKAADHRMADVQEMTVATDRLVRQNLPCLETT